MEQFFLNTPPEGLVAITSEIADMVRHGSVANGICQVFVPHTTAGVTVNENADPDVVTDLLAAFKELVPDLRYRHREGNSAAHVKSSLVGCSVTLPVVDHNLQLGTWQGIYFCEFDGPRRRQVFVQLVGEK